MRSYSRIILLLLASAFPALTAMADGLMRPVSTSYPKDFLRHRTTNVDVTMYGQVAQTKVYQEFVNEWDASTDAIFSFPLPPDARATNFTYWVGDSAYKAVLQVKDQAPNPGTGSGGIDASLNIYLGPNAIRILIHGIAAGALQRVQLEYLSLCDFHQGTVEYHYPLGTSDFSPYPIDDVSFTFRVNATGDIQTTNLVGISSPTMTTQDARHLIVSADQPKMYLTSDLSFSYSVKHDSLGIDFYSVASDTMDGHFVMMLNPPSGGADATVLPKNVVFVVDCSSELLNESLDASKEAISGCIRNLGAADSFSVVAFDYSVRVWSSRLLPATGAMTDSAVAYLTSLGYSPGSNLSSALTASLGIFKNPDANNFIILVSDGKVVIDPKAVRAQNTLKAAIFPVSVATTAGRQRLEMLAYLNYGYPTFFPTNGDITGEMLRLFDEVSYPVWRDVRYEISSSVYDLLPVGLPNLFKGSRMFLAGRYKTPGTLTLSLAGWTSAGATFLDLPLTFSASKTENDFAKIFWAKEKIDDIERTISVYGATDSLKKADIALSLGYGVRCMYTAYVADQNVSGGTPVAEQVTLSAVAATRTATGVSIVWKASLPARVKRVNIYRKTPADEALRLIASVGGDTGSYFDLSAPKGKVFYRIELVTDDGTSLFSDIVNPDGASPVLFDLGQNFPNPFNPVTQIEYSVAEAGFVSLAVYNTLGERVAVLINEQMPRGIYTASFNGSSLPSGAYFYRLSAGTFVQTKRMLLMK